jgi:hypothetical protein
MVLPAVHDRRALNAACNILDSAVDLNGSFKPLEVGLTVSRYDVLIDLGVPAGEAVRDAVMVVHRDVGRSLVMLVDALIGRAVKRDHRVSPREYFLDAYRAAPLDVRPSSAWPPLSDLLNGAARRS